MATRTFKIGDMVVHQIIEMVHGFTPALQFLPKLTPEKLDENRAWLRSIQALDERDHLLLPYQSYIVRTGRHVVLVDSCIGNDKSVPARDLWHRKNDNVFMDGLAEIGLRVSDVDFVLCTHLHTDHVGWNTRLDNGRWMPTFPNARYLFSKTELDYWLEKNERKTIAPIAESVLPILEAKQHQVVTSDHALDDLVQLIPTPGHTIDHYAVTLGRGGKAAVITGDLIHSPLQARWPDLSARVDYDPEQSAATRRRFLETYCDTGTQCCFAHFPLPSRGYIKRSGDGFRCDYIGT